MNEEKKQRWNVEGLLIQSITESSKDIADDFSPIWRPLVRLITAIVFSARRTNECMNMVFDN